MTLPVIRGPDDPVICMDCGRTIIHSPGCAVHERPALSGNAARAQRWRDRQHLKRRGTPPRLELWR